LAPDSPDQGEGCESHVRGAPAPLSSTTRRSRPLRDRRPWRLRASPRVTPSRREPSAHPEAQDAASGRAGHQGALGRPAGRHQEDRRRAELTPARLRCARPSSLHRRATGRHVLFSSD